MILAISPARMRMAARLLPIGIAAGMAGGAAEIGWILLYAQVAGGDAAAVAGGVTATIFPALGASVWAVPLGIVLHLALAVMLGAAIAVLLRAWAPQLAGTLWEPLAVVGLLVVVWAVNFLVVLPVINPAFTAAVPRAVGFVSKLLFGIAAALVLQFGERGEGAAR